MTGIGVFQSIAIGPAHLLKAGGYSPTGVLLDSDAQMESEIKALRSALEASVLEIEGIKEALAARRDSEGARILDAHIELLNDPEIRESVLDKIENKRKNANDAVLETVEEICGMFAKMDNEYLRSRAEDIRDVGNRVLRRLRQDRGDGAPEAAGPAILIAEDIRPSELIEMDPQRVAGFATRKGGKTSHLAIMARMRGIPAVVGCGEELASVHEGDTVILDGSDGQVILNPDGATAAAYLDKKARLEQAARSLKALRLLPARTADGTDVKLLANIAYPEEISEVFENGGEGIGLMRSEMLFLNRPTMPGEEEQYHFYKEAAIKAGGRPVILRTIDIGGDKQAPWLGLEKEENPFLGYRAIRICLDRKDIFRAQLRAILRASAFGDLRILLPMVVSVQEITESRMLIRDIMKELTAQGFDFNRSIQVGTMIEVPAAVASADLLAAHADFFSIGTNDLVQYSLAVDRMNGRIKKLYDPYNPGVLRMIRHTVEEAKKRGIEAGMCGEFASDALAAPLLLGMGLREFSMSASSIPEFKKTIRNIRILDAERITGEALKMETSDEIRQYLEGASR